MGVSNWSTSRLVRLICCQIMLTVSGPGILLICCPLAINQFSVLSCDYRVLYRHSLFNRKQMEINLTNYFYYIIFCILIRFINIFGYIFSYLMTEEFWHTDRRTDALRNKALFMMYITLLRCWIVIVWYNECLIMICSNMLLRLKFIQNYVSSIYRIILSLFV